MKKIKLPESLLQTLSYVNKYSPYYKNLFYKNKIDIANIKTYEEFCKLPFTSKKDVSYNNDKFCVKDFPIAEWVTTSGTTTNPISVPLTNNDLKRLQKNEKFSLGFSGVSKNDRVLIAVAMDKLFMAGIAYYMGAKSLGAEVLRAGASSSEFVLNSIKRFKPTVLIGVPSFLIKIAKQAIDLKTDLKNEGLKSIIAIGEPVALKNFKRNYIGSELEKISKVKVLSTYASTEMATSFCECRYQNGGHYLNNLLFLEILKEDKTPAMPGEMGEVVITPLNIEGFPLLRYETGDIAIFHSEECSCGYKKGRLSPVIGRKSQMLKIKGTTVFLSSIIDAVSSLKEISSFFITVNKATTLSDDISIKVSIHNNYKKNINLIKDKLNGLLKFTPNLKIDSDESIQKLQVSNGTKKRLFTIVSNNIVH